MMIHYESVGDQDISSKNVSGGETCGDAVECAVEVRPVKHLAAKFPIQPKEVASGILRRKVAKVTLRLSPGKAGGFKRCEPLKAAMRGR